MTTLEASRQEAEQVPGRLEQAFEAVKHAGSVVAHNVFEVVTLQAHLPEQPLAKVGDHTFPNNHPEHNQNA